MQTSIHAKPFNYMHWTTCEQHLTNKKKEKKNASRSFQIALPFIFLSLSDLCQLTIHYDPQQIIFIIDFAIKHWHWHFTLGCRRHTCEIWISHVHKIHQVNWSKQKTVSKKCSLVTQHAGNNVGTTWQGKTPVGPLAVTGTASLAPAFCDLPRMSCIALSEPIKFREILVNLVAYPCLHSVCSEAVPIVVLSHCAVHIHTM